MFAISLKDYNKW